MKKENRTYRQGLKDGFNLALNIIQSTIKNQRVAFPEYMEVIEKYERGVKIKEEKNDSK